MSDLLNSASLVMIPSGYKEDIVYSQIPTNGSGDLSFTRASNGTRINSAGLVEVCPWNLLQQSNTFNASPWSMNVTSGQAGKDGQNNAWLLTKLTATTSDYYLNNVYNGDQTFTIYVKKESSKGFKLYPIGTTTENVEVNLQTGVVYLATAGITSTTVEAYSSTWWKISVALNMINSNYYIYVTNGAGTQIASSITIQDAQVNIGLTAKPYFPTTDRLNVPRLTYQNGGGGCPSLLLEKQSTNLVLYSQDISNTSGSSWGDGSSGGTATVTANYATSPDGTQNATRIQLNEGSLYAVWQQVISTTAGTTYSYSIWLKAVSGTPTILWLYDGTANQNVTLTNEWVRYTFTFTGGTLAIARFGLWSSVWGTSTTADILAWGAQLEASSYVTTLIPTTSSSATRVADAYSRSLSSIISGTAYINITDNVALGSVGTHLYGPFSITGASLGLHLSRPNNQRLRLWTQASANVFQTTVTNLKLAITWDGTNVNVYQNGVKVVTNYSYALTNVNNLFSNTNLESSATIAEIVLFNSVLTDAECISLTS